jgi:hypothetical protein
MCPPGDAGPLGSRLRWCSSSIRITLFSLLHSFFPSQPEIVGVPETSKEIAIMKSPWIKTRSAFRLLPALLVLTSSSFAATYYVGTCHSPSYSTISAAVAAVPANSIIDVCPGTYAEQAFINQPLTLQGVKNGSAERARIVPPAKVGGVIPWAIVPNPISGELPIAPQIFVNVSTGTVKLSNLTADASAETTAPSCSTAAYVTTGIAYQDSSGLITHDSTLGQGKYSGCGVGILALAASSNTVSVTITNNSVQDANLAGIKLEATQGNAGLKVDVTGNSVTQGNGTISMAAGISVFGVSGTVASNFITAATITNEYVNVYGIWEVPENDVGPLSFSNNTILSSFAGWAGIAVQIPTAHTRTVSGNNIAGYPLGIVTGGRIGRAGTLDLQGNQISNSSWGIDLGCVLPTLSGNIINNAALGVIDVPGGAAPAGVALYNVDKRASGGCR